MKVEQSSVNHGIINLKKESKYIPQPQFKRRDMLIWYIETRLEELNNISLGTTKDRLLASQNEYQRLKSGIHWLLTRPYEQSFSSSQELFEFIQSGISQNLNTLKTTLINHINNNHIPQSIDFNKYQHLVNIQQDWQKYMNLIINIVE